MGCLRDKPRDWIHVLALPFACSVALDKSLALSGPPFSHLQNRVMNPHIAGSVGFNKLQAQCPPGAYKWFSGARSVHIHRVCSQPRGAGPKCDNRNRAPRPEGTKTSRSRSISSHIQNPPVRTGQGTSPQPQSLPCPIICTRGFFLTARQRLQHSAHKIRPRKVWYCSTHPRCPEEQRVAQDSELWGREEPLKASEQGQDLS